MTQPTPTDALAELLDNPPSEQEIAELVRYMTPGEKRRLERMLRHAPLSLYEYMQAIWSIVEPDTRFVKSWHIEAICEHLEAVTNREIRNLIINVPPRHTKSLCVSVAWPTWAWTVNPSLRFMFASYSSGLSIEHAVLSRRILDSDWYKARWGRSVILTTDQNVKSHYENTARGYRISTSTGGTVTGKGADFLVVDDPHSVHDVHSATVRQGVVDWYRRVWSTRLNDPKTGCKVVIMQRCHEQDLAAELIEQGGYELLCLPTEYEGDKHPTSIGWTDPRPAPGDLLCPERFGPEEVSEAKRTLGSYGYAAQHQQRPSPATGGIFQREWWRFFEQQPEGIEEIVLSWDCAFKDADESSYVVGQAWGRRGAERYLLDQVRDHMTFSGTVVAVRALCAKYPQARAVLIEDKANGTAVLDTLRREVPRLIPVQPVGGKVARAHAVQPEVEAGNVLLPRRASWVGDFVEEMATFPAGQHDDQVDAMTQTLSYFHRRRGRAQLRQVTGI